MSERFKEIKTVLARCGSETTTAMCAKCPYRETYNFNCVTRMAQEALAAIKTLEEENADIAYAHSEFFAENRKLKRRIRRLKKQIRKTKWYRPDEKEPPYHTELKLWTNERREYIAQLTLNEEWLTEGFLQVHGVTHWAYLDDAPEEE